MQPFASPVAASPFAAANPLDTGSTNGSNGTNSSSDSNSATITANDFLQLLVTEMQNQDPTADTDPNEYINQLVQVNSLEQLISINQELGGTSSSTPGGATGNAVAAMGAQADGSTPLASGNAAATVPAQIGGATSGASGNLSATDSGPSGSRIADALGAAAHTLAPGSSSGPLQSALHALKSHPHAARTTLSNPAQ